MILFLASGYRTTRYRLRRLWAWAVLHPKTAMLLLLGVCWLVSAIIAVPAAYADGSANSSAPPYMPPTDLKDSSGVPLWRYSVLPLDRGDVWHPTKTVVSGIVDGVWIFNLACLSWCLWLLSFLLEFTWVDWIATPVGAIATTMQSVLSQVGWPALAMMIAGGVFGMAIALGKFARGTIDLFVSILCFVLATGALANPVTALTGEHGALTWAQSTGANLSVSVLDTGRRPHRHPRQVPGTGDDLAVADGRAHRRLRPHPRAGGRLRTLPGRRMRHHVHQPDEKRLRLRHQLHYRPRRRRQV